MPVLNSATRDYALRTTPVLCATASRVGDTLVPRALAVRARLADAGGPREMAAIVREGARTARPVMVDSGVARRARILKNGPGALG
jgi:hypothetical protein